MLILHYPWRLFPWAQHCILCIVFVWCVSLWCVVVSEGGCMFFFGESYQMSVEIWREWIFLSTNAYVAWYRTWHVWAYKLHTRSIQLSHAKLVYVLYKNLQCIQIVGLYIRTCEFHMECIRVVKKHTTYPSLCVCKVFVQVSYNFHVGTSYVLSSWLTTLLHIIRMHMRIRQQATHWNQKMTTLTTAMNPPLDHGWCPPPP